MWDFYLARTDNLSLINQLPARSRKLDVTLNRSGSASCTIPLDSEEALDVKALSTSLVVARKGVVRWTGPVWTLDVKAETNSIAINAVGWLEELNHRQVRASYTDLRPVTVPTQQVTYTNADAGLIARNLISLANAQMDMLGTVRPTHIVLPGTYPTSQNRTKTYNPGVNIGQAIQELSDIEAGFDFYIDPLLRTFVIKYDTVVSGSTIRGIGSDRRDLVLAYSWGPANLADAGYTTDAGRMCNRMVVKGQYGSAIAEDRQAMNETGFMFEEQANLAGPGSNENSILLAYAGAEVAVRAKPVRVYNVQPFPPNAGEQFPEPFVDFGIGDVVSLSARSGAWTEQNRAVRIFGMTIDVDENDNERISALQLSAS